MRKSNKRLSDLLFNKPTKVEKEKSGLPEINLNKPIPVGHKLAVNCYDEGKYEETFFLDGIDVCNSHTVFHFGRNFLENLFFSVAHTHQTSYSTEVYYTNGTHIEIIRIA